jgi:hypothetical protein
MTPSGSKNGVFVVLPRVTLRYTLGYYMKPRCGQEQEKHPSTSFDIALTGDFDNPVERE